MRAKPLPGHISQSLAGPLLTLFFSSEKLRAGHDAMLQMLKTAAEASVHV
ncbi:hypothetical protein [Nocardia sp. NPDC051981]